MAYCLPKQLATEFKKRILNGELNPDMLINSTSKQRREFFEQFLPTAHAKEVNGLIESKLILKNQQAGLIRALKQLTGITPERKTDMISKVKKMGDILTPQNEDAFFEDLAERELGIAVEMKTAQNLAELAQVVAVKKAQIPEGSPDGSLARIEYGMALLKFRQYWQDLVNNANKATWQDFFKHPVKILAEVSGISRVLRTTLDIGFTFRQGMKSLFGTPAVKKAWFNGLVDSLKALPRGFKSESGMDYLKADILSRENAMAGRYKKGGLDVEGIKEEEFPTSVLNKIPLLGNAFRGFEFAYNAYALRLRADLADLYINTAVKHGVDINDKKELKGIMRLANSLSGRGDIGTLAIHGDLINALVFSMRFFKANLETLTDVVNPNVTPFTRKQAGLNLVSIIAHMALIMSIAMAIDDESVELDPRSSDFGKIKVGNTRFDISGGMASLTVLASRLITRSSKSPTSGKVKSLTSNEFGARTMQDVLMDFASGKLAPTARLAWDILFVGEHFAGEPITVKSSIFNLTVPLDVEGYLEALEDPNSANELLVFIADAIGISANTFGSSSKSSSKSKTFSTPSLNTKSKGFKTQGFNF